MDEVKIIVGDQFPSKSSIYPESFFLKNNLWDDYSYTTTYQAYYIDNKKEFHDIGRTKIARKNLKAQERPLGCGLINEITEDYFSLGQDQSFYQSLRDIPNDIGTKFLLFLRDISFDRDIWTENQSLEVLRYSLFRDVTKMDAISFKGIFKGDDRKLDYQLIIPKESTTKFIVDHKLPYKNSNIHALIGNNGVGKTTFLKSLAKCIIEKDFECKIISENELKGTNKGIDIDYIERVLFVSFSAFDNSNLDFKTRSRFDYLGLHDGNGGFKGPEVLSKEFECSLESLINSKKIEYIKKVLEPLKNVGYLGEHIEFFFENIGEIPKIVSMYKKLSSGHRIVLHTLVLLMDMLHQGVVTLFDEPETHLHPPLLGAFLQSIQEVCDEYNGLLIFATHSPIILQETLSENVFVLRRFDNELALDKPDVVTYGQNVSKLTRTAFGYQNVGFHKTVRELVDNSSITKENISLNDQLGSEAKKVAWNAIYGSEDV
ncbi:AAA family ATPase [Vibrio hibernica]|uniref:AAA family ATPase n=1 Tax=Vibrio hibernica TaxID=2587465 RepID=UPI0018815026|nr:AAA family ATPase [Vibrio hibernica]